LSHDRKIHRKRKIVIIALVLTIGTSLGLWSYRSLKTVRLNFSLPSFRFPQTSSTVNTTSPDFDKIVDPIISADANSWSIYLAVNSEKNPPFYWQKNGTNLIPDNNSKTIIDSLKKEDSNPSTTLSNVLPPGAVIKEKIVIDKSDQFQVYYLITIPGNDFFIAVDIIGSHSLDVSKKVLPSVVEKIYWPLVSFVN
jgi:hypothetical protein